MKNKFKKDIKLIIIAFVITIGFVGTVMFLIWVMAQAYKNIFMLS
jgi:hypothetical protein